MEIKILKTIKDKIVERKRKPIQVIFAVVKLEG